LLQELTRRFQEAGVLQVIGTDASLPGVFPGKAVHRELTELVKAGLSNFDALSIGTRNAGELVRKYLDSTSRFGRIEPGYRADFVLVEGNPLEDVRNARNVIGVAVAGRWMDAVDLESRRAALAAEYAAMNQLTAQIDEALQKKGAEAALRRVVAAHRDNPESVGMIRDRVNSAGYGAFFEGDVDLAHKILEVGTRVFPEEANAWDSLGEVTLHMGNRDKAIEHYRMALQIDPDFASSKAQLQKLLE
jgi:tetratricopeptide (TPR) repeat protein